MTQQPNLSSNLNPDALAVDAIKQYIELQNYKPLSEKELQKGKSYLKVYGTQTDMPWSTIYARLASGQPIKEVTKQYGHARKLCLWAQEDAVALDTQMKQLIDDEIQVRAKVVQLANADPIKAETLLHRVNEKYPDFQGNLALFADKMVRKAVDKLDDKYLEAADMEKLAKAVQTTTDIVGVTQRHSAGVTVNSGEIKVQGFTFGLDLPQEQQEQLKTYTVEELDAMTTAPIPTPTTKGNNDG